MTTTWIRHAWSSIVSRLHAGPFMIDLVSCDFVDQGHEFWRRAHGSAGLVTVDKEHQSAGILVEPRQHCLVAIGQATGRLRVQNVDATKELPLLRGQFGPLPVASDDRVPGHRHINATTRDIFRGAGIWGEGPKGAG